MPAALTREQVRRLDAIAIDELGIPGVVLMENAGRGAAQIIEREAAARGLGRVVIFCGAGNNGGDGFVIARHLLNAGVKVAVRLAVAEDAIRGDALVNFRILRNIGLETPAAQDVRGALVPHTRKDDLIVDALLGTGFQGQVRDPLAGIITAINGASKGLTIAVDVPSGLDCDMGEPGGVAFRADQTVTFVAPKVGFSKPGALEWTGSVSVVGIGTPPWLIDRVINEAI